jgi:hypothetical protein
VAQVRSSTKDAVRRKLQSLLQWHDDINLHRRPFPMFTVILHLLWRPSGFAFSLGVECRCSSPLFAAGREGSDCFLVMLFWVLLAIFEVLLLIVVFLIWPVCTLCWGSQNISYDTNPRSILCICKAMEDRIPLKTGSGKVVPA